MCSTIDWFPIRPPSQSVARFHVSGYRNDIKEPSNRPLANEIIFVGDLCQQ